MAGNVLPVGPSVRQPTGYFSTMHRIGLPTLATALRFAGTP